MNSLFDLLVKVSDPDIRGKALDALITVISKNFHYMESYLETFQQMTEAFLKLPDDDGKIAQSSVEIWSTLFDEYLARKEAQATNGSQQD